MTHPGLAKSTRTMERTVIGDVEEKYETNRVNLWNLFKTNVVLTNHVFLFLYKRSFLGDGCMNSWFGQTGPWISLDEELGGQFAKTSKNSKLNRHVMDQYIVHLLSPQNRIVKQSNRQVLATFGSRGSQFSKTTVFAKNFVLMCYLQKNGVVDVQLNVFGGLCSLEKYQTTWFLFMARYFLQPLDYGALAAKAAEGEANISSMTSRGAAWVACEQMWTEISFYIVFLYWCLYLFWRNVFRNNSCIGFVLLLIDCPWILEVFVVMLSVRWFSI